MGSSVNGILVGLIIPFGDSSTLMWTQRRGATRRNLACPVEMRLIVCPMWNYAHMLAAAADGSSSRDNRLAPVHETYRSSGRSPTVEKQAASISLKLRYGAEGSL